LGKRESGTGRLEEAVSIYREVLKERKRKRAPLGWAATQNNLGVALQELGRRESGKRRLKDALSAYREALKERTRERGPLEWAATQNNLGIVLHTLGEQEGGTERLEEARAAIASARDVYREAGIDRYDPSFESRLRSIDDLIANQRSAS
jgi:tetratricopeptide (TPR) repeat protein